jgi:hypothetical protein
VVDARASILALGFGALVANSSDLDLAQELVAEAEALSQSTRAAVPLQAIAVRSLGALMQGRSADSVAVAEELIALAPDEPDVFVRLHALQIVLASFAITFQLDRFEELRRDVVASADQLGSQFLISSTAMSLAPVAHLLDPDHAEEVLLRGYELSEQFGNLQANASHAMFVALHYLRLRDEAAAAMWTRRSLQLSIEHAPAFIAQVINTVVAVTKNRSPADAAVLLGALRTYRAHKKQSGTEAEIDAEVRYEESLRRRLGDEFDQLFAEGSALDEPAMLEFAFAHLEAGADVA